MDDRRYRCPGFVCKPVGPDELELVHSPRSTLSTTLDLKGLEFLLRFGEPATLAEAIAHFQSRGWTLADDEYAGALEQLIAGRLLVVDEDGVAGPAAIAAPTGPSPAAGDLPRIGPALPDEAAAIAALHDELMTDIERKQRAARGEVGTRRGALFAGLASLSEEGRALVYLCVERTVRIGDRRRDRSVLGEHYARFYVTLVPFEDILAEVAAAGYLGTGTAVELLVPDDEIFPIFETLGADFEVRALAREWRLRQASAESLHLVARDANGVIGYLEGRYLLHDRVYDEGEIVTLIVAERARQHGIGALLVQAFQVNATEKGVLMLKVPTQHANLRGIAFYERAGFKKDERDIFLRWWTPRRQGPARP